MVPDSKETTKETLSPSKSKETTWPVIHKDKVTNEAISKAAAGFSFVGAGYPGVDGEYKRIEDINGAPAYKNLASDLVVRKSTYGFWLVVKEARKNLSNNCIYWHDSKSKTVPAGAWSSPDWVTKHLIEDRLMPEWGKAPIAIASSSPLAMATVDSSTHLHTQAHAHTHTHEAKSAPTAAPIATPPYQGNGGIGIDEPPPSYEEAVLGDMQ